MPEFHPEILPDAYRRICDDTRHAAEIATRGPATTTVTATWSATQTRLSTGPTSTSEAATPPSGTCPEATQPPSAA